MHARELIELAALVSVHGPVLIRGNGQLSPSGVEQYWAASKCRLDRWGRCIKQLSAQSPQATPVWRRTHVPLIRRVFEEILTGEILTRVWTAVLCAYDRHHGTDTGEPVARSVMIGHMEARHRVLALMVSGPGVDAEEAVRLNHLRRRTERWTDMLVGYLAGMHDISEFAIDPHRARDFAEDIHYGSQLKGGQSAWPLVIASLRAAFRQNLDPVSPNSDLNAKIAAGILSCFRPELFDSIGVFQSLWLLRLTNTATDAQGLVEDLLGDRDFAAPGNDVPLGSIELGDGGHRFGDMG
ncbi:MAG: hypothetical protein HQ581_05025 [Planctomycetes bacterium]|nr:hypothetical protein [Planctomycetota bacterium]